MYGRFSFYICQIIGHFSVVFRAKIDLGLKVFIWYTPNKGKIYEHFLCKYWWFGLKCSFYVSNSGWQNCRVSLEPKLISLLRNYRGRCCSHELIRKSTWTVRRRRRRYYIRGESHAITALSQSLNWVAELGGMRRIKENIIIISVRASLRADSTVTPINTVPNEVFVVG